jgi:hypothetical protein
MHLKSCNDVVGLKFVSDEYCLRIVDADGFTTTASWWREARGFWYGVFKAEFLGAGRGEHETY